ncbi:MAG: oligosaccharide flippase family protein [Ignavibacteriaceae bacterium]|nr:oligosaccharide flippase family protein [Ignavibacteriaceae bacterium]
MKKLLIKNSLFGFGQSIVNFLLILIAVPIFIKMLGIESYGVFALVMVVGNLNTFANLGIVNALVKYIASQGKTKESNFDIAVNIILTVLVIFPLTLLAIYLNKFILLDLLKVPLKLFAEANLLYYWLLCTNILLLIGQIFKSILDALQKIYITSLLQLFYNILYWGLILLTLILGYNLSSIGVAIFASALIWFIFILIKALKEWGSLSLKGLRNNFKYSAKKQLNYGLKIYASGLLGFFAEPLMKILISNFIGIVEVGFFDIALKLKNQLSGVISQIFYPLFPFIAEQKDKSLIRKYIHDLEQKTFYLIVPIIVIINFTMYSFINIWLGNNNDIISITAILFISFYLLGSSTVLPMYMFLLAKDFVDKILFIQFLNTLFYIISFLITVKTIGYFSIIISYSTAILSSFICLIYYQKKYLNSFIFDSSMNFIKLLIIGCLLFSIGTITNLFITTNLLRLVIDPIIIVLVSIILYRKFKMITILDIERYTGNDTKLANLIIKLFMK